MQQENKNICEQFFSNGKKAQEQLFYLSCYSKTRQQKQKSLNEISRKYN